MRLRTSSNGKVDKFSWPNDDMVKSRRRRNPPQVQEGLISPSSKDLFRGPQRSRNPKSIQRESDKSKLEESCTETRSHPVPVYKEPIGSLDEFNILIKSAVESNNLAHSRTLFNLMITKGFIPNLETLTTILQGFTHAKDLAGVEKVRKRLELLRIVPDLAFLKSLLCAYVELDDIPRASEVFNEALQKEHSLDVEFFNYMLTGYGKSQDLLSLQRTYERMIDMKFQPNESTMTIMIESFLKAGDIHNAVAWMEATLGKDSLTGLPFQPPLGLQPTAENFAVLIHYFCSLGKMEEAYHWLDRMNVAGLTPNISTISYLAEGCGRAGNLKVARAILKEMESSSRRPSVHFYNAFLDGYVKIKRNDYEQVLTILARMRWKGIRPDATTYNIIISWLASAGDYRQAIGVYENMRENGLCCSLETTIILLWRMGTYGYRDNFQTYVNIPLLELLPKSISGEPDPPPLLLSGDISSLAYDLAVLKEKAFRIYQDYRVQLRNSKINAELAVYDAAVALFTNASDLNGAFNVILDAINDKCFIDLNILARFAKLSGRLRDWRVTKVHFNKIMQLVRLHICNMDPATTLLSHSETLSMSILPLQQSSNKADSTKPKLNTDNDELVAYHRHLLEGVPAAITEVLLASFPYYAFKLLWKNPLKNLDDIRRKSLILRFDRELNQNYLTNQLRSDEDGLLLWDLVLQLRHYQELNISPLPLGFEGSFYDFCMLFLWHCKLHEMWVCHKVILQWLQENRDGFKVKDALKWVKWFYCEYTPNRRISQK
ncbi:hypothetical protein HDU97_003429 [Phlyctochytrium planicorne]|nr:hypothetical protein HDU97_003429 [Phlyctochytrium planicorne]